ncbi:MAG: hypothetical protein NC548_30390 [Lachnospiraceae bacterium]|nr:hypothetical protein [Lachnospiraceae bacterium]
MNMFFQGREYEPIKHWYRLKSKVGERHGKVVITELLGRWHKNTYYKAVCDCGTEFAVNGGTSIPQSCGCQPLYKNLTGKKFGHLTAIEPIRKSKLGTIWRCECDCGTITEVPISRLNSGNTKSCGCQKYRTTHCGTGSRLFFIWRNIKSRCYNPKFIGYENYGGRGITMCEEWLHDFAAFQIWALNNGYTEFLTIERIDNNGNYEPSNCRWATMKEQGNNRRTNRHLTANGESKTISQWAEELDISRELIRSRIRAGWSAEDALFTPKGGRKKI